MTHTRASVGDRAFRLRHMPFLDSVRGAAILMVLFFHGFGSYNWTPLAGTRLGPLLHALVSYGRFGVQLFFILSGFLITGLLIKARERTGYYTNFYVRRVLRIIPIYLVMLVVLKVWQPVSWPFMVASLLFMANFSRLFGAPLHEYGSLWSLAVEEHFYLLWPTFVRRLRIERLLSFLVGLVVLEPVLRTIAINIYPNLDIHYKTPFVLDYLAYGALVALLLHTGRLHLENMRQAGVGLLAVGGSLTAVTLWLTAFHWSSTLSALVEVPFEWACCGILLIGLKSDHVRQVKTGRTDSSGILPFFGYISYGLYLVNVFIFDKLGKYLDRHVAPGVVVEADLGMLTMRFLACASLATLIAFLSREYFEAPILRLKDKWQSRSLRHAGRHADVAVIENVA